MSMKDRVVNLYYELKDRFTGKAGKISSSLEDIEKSAKKSSKAIEKNNSRLTKTFHSLIGLSGKVAASLGAIFGIGAGGLLSGIVSVGSEFEKLKVSLETVTGSAEDAEKAFQLITDFAKETPYSVEEITRAFIKLKALGLDPSEEALRSYGNTASAMGKTLDQFVEAVADAAVGEFERLKEFGIKARSEGENVSLTFQGVTTTVSKNATEIEAYLRSIGNVQFAGGMEKQMDTVQGAFSNLKDNISALANKLYESGIGKAIQSILQRASEAIKGLTGSADKTAAKIISYSKNVTIGVVNAFSYVKLAWQGLTIAFKTGGAIITGLLSDITQGLSFLSFGETSRELKQFSEELKMVTNEIAKDIGKDAFDFTQMVSNISSGKNTRDIENAFNQMLEDVKPKVPTIDMTESLKKAKEAMKTIEQEEFNIRVNAMVDPDQIRKAINDQFKKALESSSDKTGQKL